MKYSHMLLITLVISLLWGLLLFLLGVILRFKQAMLMNNFVEGLEDSTNLKACQSPNDPDINVCVTETSFDEVQLGDWANYFGSTTIVTAFFIILLSACGFAGVVKKSQALLLLMLVLIIVGIGMEYYILDIIMDTEGSYHDSAKSELKDRVNKEYFLEKEKANSFVRWFNALMLQGECCGVSGPSDFDVNVSVTLGAGSGRDMYVLKIPPACCVQENFLEQDLQRAFTDLLTCGSDPWAVAATQVGCYDKIFKELYESYGMMLVGFIMFLILWEGVQGILLFMIILRPAPRSPRKSAASSAASTRSAGKGPGQEPPKKKFIPFSKISSHVTADVNRIKSTEIW